MAQTTYFNQSIAKGTEIIIDTPSTDLTTKLYFSGNLSSQFSGSCFGTALIPFFSGTCQLDSEGKYQNTFTVSQGCSSATITVLFKLNSYSSTQSKLSFTWTDSASTQSFIGHQVISSLVLTKIEVDNTTKINKQLDEGTSVSFDLETSAPYPAECDGGCYCYCDGIDIGTYDESYMCPGTYTSLADDASIYPGQVVLVKPYIQSGYTFDYMIINGTVYGSPAQVRVTAGSSINIAIKTVPANKRVVATNVTISGNGTPDAIATISGLTKGKKTKFVISGGNYKSTYTETYPAYCDGCYCWCGDIEVGYDDECIYTYTSSKNISNGYYLTESDSINLNTDSGVVNPQLVITANNTIALKGYNSTGTPSAKTITISKIEQYD